MQQLHIPGDQDQIINYYKSKRITSKLSTTNTHIAEPLLGFFFWMTVGLLHHPTQMQFATLDSTAPSKAQ